MRDCTAIWMVEVSVYLYGHPVTYYSCYVISMKVSYAFGWTRIIANAFIYPQCYWKSSVEAINSPKWNPLQRYKDYWKRENFLGKIFSFIPDFSVFPWLIYKKQDNCSIILVWIGAVSLCWIPQRLTFGHWVSRLANGKTNHSEAINDKDKTSPP